MTATPECGVLLVDKPGGVTSHDVVARARRARDVRRIGHAGTLDPMATGLLILGVGAATRLLSYLVGLDKTYTATIRLGLATDSDDADGRVTGRADPAALAALTDAAVAGGVAALTGPIAQVPSRVSAVKIGGRRAYELARHGVEVALPPRDVLVSRFEVTGIRRSPEAVDVDAVVDCGSGTYVRALARDLGAALGVGGHLTVLRRTRIGPFPVTDAVPVERVGDGVLRTPAAVASAVLPTVRPDADQACALRQGRAVTGLPAGFAGPHAAAVDPDGVLVGVVRRDGDALRSVMNLPREQPR